jgi:hypothetical protein
MGRRAEAHEEAAAAVSALERMTSRLPLAYLQEP